MPSDCLCLLMTLPHGEAFSTVTFAADAASCASISSCSCFFRSCSACSSKACLFCSAAAHAMFAACSASTWRQKSDKVDLLCFEEVFDAMLEMLS